MVESRSQPARSSFTADRSPSIFVGRQRELAELKASLHDALSGRGQLVMLVGEPGIGKTRTAQELAALAGLAGARAVWGRCYEQPGMLPYWPWVQAIRALIQDREPHLLRSELGPWAAEIAEVVPDIQVMLPDIQPPPSLEPDQARFRLFHSITTFLKNAAQTQPVVIILDNLHWADRPTLLLLEFLGQEVEDSALLVLGTYRDVDLSRQHPLVETLGELTRNQLFRRIVLGGLNREDVGRFIGAVTGGQLTDALVDLVYSHTEGNPLFVAELLRMLDQEGQLTADGATDPRDWQMKIPDGIREAIGRRLNRLSDRCNEVLTNASVIGREFDFKVLRMLMEKDTESQLFDALEEALSARLIEELAQPIGAYQFSHALVQETLAAELSINRRVRVHAKVAEALEHVYGSHEGHAAALAYHYAEAMTVTGTEKMVCYSLMAGEQALAMYAWDEALGYFERGLVANQISVNGTEPATDGEAAALLFGLGRAQVATLPLFQLQEAAVTLTRSFDYYAKEGDIDQVVAIAEHPFPPTAGRNTGALQIIERALKLVPPASRQSGRLLARYGWLMGVVEANYEESRDPFSQAMDIARNEGDTVLALQTLISAAEVDQFHLHFEDCLCKSLEAIELIAKINDPRAEALAHFYAGQAFRATGDSVEAERHIRDSIAAAERLHHHFYLGRALNFACWLSYCKGEWQAARDFSDRGLAASPRETRLLHTRVMLEHEVGNFSDGKDYLDRLLEVMRVTAPGPVYEYAFPAMVIPMAARISGDRGWFAVAQAATESVLSSSSVTPMVAAMTKNGLALLAEQQEDIAAAKQLYEGLERHEIVGTLGIQVDRLFGLLAQTAGKLDQAAHHFEDALAFCRKAGYRPELAWTCCDYADTLRERDEEGDRSMAITLLDESLAISSELEMRPLMKRVHKRLERMESQPGSAPAYPNGLTRREVEVLRLIAVGKSSRDVANDLVLSTRTVERHITNIYGKINARGRADAAAYALGHELIDQNRPT